MGMEGYPWERYGLIVELTVRMQAISPQFGKTAIQKMIYLLQAVYTVDYGYEYSFYTYGPYSFDLS
ncbi:MAG: restriction endonuclease, partial [Dethiobacteria bacterium]